MSCELWVCFLWLTSVLSLLPSVAPVPAVLTSRLKPYPPVASVKAQPADYFPDNKDAKTGE
jgi:hypothetical protein